MSRLLLGSASVFAVFALAGCGSRQQPTYAPAPPVQGQVVQQQPMPMGSNEPIPVGGQNLPADNGVYHWRDVPVGQMVPVVRATFDQGGYQLYAQSGETIVVPFENQNLHVLKFGRSRNGSLYFLNEAGTAPVLYVPNGGYLENSLASGARWYPLPNDFAYTRPVYVTIAPSWNAWTGMGWYPGMTLYGGMWGYNPGLSFAWMPSFYVNIGGRRYSDWGGYTSYYRSNPGYIRNSVVYRNYNAARPSGRASGFGAGRSATTRSYSNNRSSGYSGFGRNSSGFRSNSNSSGFRSGSNYGSGTGSFGRTGSGFGSSRPSSSFGSGSGFGGSRPSSSFGSSRPSSSFGSGGSGVSGSSFGRNSSSSFSGSRSSGSSFGSGRTSSGSFSSGSSSFGSGRSSGSSFGTSRPSSGGGSSFGGGSFRSSGSSFGGSRPSSSFRSSGSSFGSGSGSSFRSSGSSFGGGGRSSFGSGRRR